MDVSIIIVNYNTKDLLKNCIESIAEQTKDVSYEIIVSDNGSTDGSVEMLRQMMAEQPQSGLRLLENGANLGFGAANNRALAIAEGKYIFYLNSDTILLNNAVKLLYDYWENAADADEIGALGCQLLSPDQRPAHSYGAFPTPFGVVKAFVHMYMVWILKQVPKAGGTVEGIAVPTAVDGYITGADLFLLNTEAATFDERYFMYAEEADLQFNHFAKKGKKRVILPEPKIIHYEGASDTTRQGRAQEKVPYDFGRRSVAWLWISNLKYLKKNYPKSGSVVRLMGRMLRLVWKKCDDRELAASYERLLSDL